MKSSNTKWIYDGKQIKTIDDIPECCPFVVYKITFPRTNDFYIGSKQIYHNRKVKLSKKRANELYSGKGGKKKTEIKTFESDWKQYKSSSKIVQERIENGEKAIFEIIKFCETKQEMLLTEAYLIIQAFIISKSPYCLNGWVSVRQNKPKCIL